MLDIDKLIYLSKTIDEAKQLIPERNRLILSLYDKGESVSNISNLSYLRPQSIYGLIHKRRESNKNG